MTGLAVLILTALIWTLWECLKAADIWKRM